MEPPISPVEEPTNVNVPASPFMALPLELRIKIYEGLLYPSRQPKRVLRDERSLPVILEDVDDVAIYQSGHTEEGEKTEEKVEDDNDNKYGQSNYEAEDRFVACWKRMGYSFDLEPTILRVNKQIHDEAISYLYKYIACQIGLVPPLPGGYSASSGFLYQHYDRRRPNDFYSRDSIALWSRRYHLDFNPESDINLPCLRWVRDIHINTSYKNIFGNALETQWFHFGADGHQSRPEGHRFTPEGELILNVLRYLKRDWPPAIPPIKRLHLTFTGGSVDFLIALSKLPVLVEEPLDRKWKAVLEGLGELISLLRSLGKSRKVTVMENFWGNEKDWTKRHLIRQVLDLESLAWIGV